MHVSYETDGEIVGGGNPNSNYSDVRHFWKRKYLTNKIYVSIRRDKKETLLVVKLWLC